MQASKRKFPPLHAVLLIALSFIVYANALTGEFVWDDELQIIKNWQIRDLTHIGTAFSSGFFSFIGNQAPLNYYRPVQTLVYTFAYQLGGLSPWVYHLVNLLFHTFAGLFLYWACLEYGISPVAALFAAAIFVVHPVHVEAVAWNAGIPDVSCGLFFIIALFCFLKFLNSNRAMWKWLAGLSFLIACLSKEMAISLPIVVVLLMFAKGRIRREEMARAAADISPFVLAGMVYLVMRVTALGFLITQHNQFQATFVDLFTMVPRIFGQYIRYALLPYPLTAFHLVPLHLSDRVLSTILYSAVIAGTVLALLLLNRRFPGVWVWSVVFAFTLIPVFNFKVISLSFFAERYLYIPSFALAFIIAIVVDGMGTNRRFPFIIVIVAMVFALLTFARNQDWQSDERLYEATVRVSPEATHIRNSLGTIYIKKGDLTHAQAFLEETLRYVDHSVYWQPDVERYRTLVALGSLDSRLGKYGEARNYFKQAIEAGPLDDWAYVYLGAISMEADADDKTAIQYLKRAIELSPYNEVSQDYMGVALFNLKQYRDAIQYFQAALKINPTYTEAQQHLAAAVRAAQS